MIGIRHNDSRNTSEPDKFVKRLVPQRNWIDNISAGGSQKASGVKVRFNSRIITVPNADIWSDSVEI